MTGVVDGDTIRISGERIVRYLGIDAPERDEPGYDESRAANDRLTRGRSVRLASTADDRDRYDRSIAVVLVDDGPSPPDDLDVGLELVRSGHAWVYQLDEESLPAQRLRDLCRAQTEAVAGRSGLWRGLDLRGDAVARLRVTQRRIHALGCRHLKGARSLPVAALESALASGKSPCRSCKPFALLRRT